MKKTNKYLLIYGIIVLVMMLIFVLVASFIVDFGINSKFFIRKDFNQAFLYRTTGDCDAFASYLNRDVEEWKERCKREKNHDEKPIRDFTIQNISHNFGSDRAFLQVELKRNIEGKDYSYSVNYEMKKVRFNWKIDQKYK